MSAQQLRRSIRRGEVKTLLRGVFLRADVPLTIELKLAAAALVISPTSVACDRTAAWIWGVDVYGYAELDGVPALESFVLSGGRRTERDGVSGGERALLPTDWVEVGGVKVTTPVRTAMDLACRLPRRSALAAMDALMRAHGFGHESMAEMLPRYFRRRGVIQLRDLVPLVDPRAESQPESWVRLELIDHGLPAPELQWWVTANGTPIYRLDLAYPHAKIAIEFDGEEFHTSPADRERDALRRTWLRAHGWTVIIVTRADFAKNDERFWVSEVAEAL
ncbi:MAG: DUF559 domain-containing protein [Nocardioides sp.]